MKGAKNQDEGDQLPSLPLNFNYWLMYQEIICAIIRIAASQYRLVVQWAMYANNEGLTDGGSMQRCPWLDWRPTDSLISRASLVERLSVTVERHVASALTSVSQCSSHSLALLCSNCVLSTSVFELDLSRLATLCYTGVWLTAYQLL